VTTLAACAAAVLNAPEPQDKVALTRRFADDWRIGRIELGGGADVPVRPARPERPLLKAPRDMARRRAGASRAGRVALLHAVAHIELNAIDLAWDLIARFGGEGRPRAFNRSARLTAIFRRITGCGRRRQRQRTIFSRGLPWCRWCSRRAGST
jgi:uncharacterized ferritin-like protein (DUF455 family)